MAAGESITPGTDIVMQTITGSAGKESIDPQDNLNDQQYYQQQLENEAKEKVKSELSAQQETEKQAEVVREDILVKIKDIENEISKIASENAARKAELASLPQNQDQRTKLQKLYDEGVQKVDTAYKEMILAKQKFDEVKSRAGQDQRYRNNEYIRDFQAARSAWAGAERSYLDAMKTAPGYTYSGEGLGWVDATLNATGDPTVFSERKYISKYDMAVSSARSVLNNIKSGIESSKDPEEINRLFTQFKEKSSYLKELEAASPFEHGKMQKIGLRPTEFLQTLDTRGGGDVENAAYNAREAEASAKQSQSQLQSRNASILASGGKLSSDQIADVSRSAMDVNIKTAEVNTITALQDYLKAAEKGDTDKLKDLEKDYIDKYVKEQSIKESQSTQLLSSIPTLGKVTDADVSPKIGTVSIDGNAMDVFSDRSTGRDFVNFFGNKISVSDINTLKQAAGGTGLFNSYGQQVMAIKDIYGKSSKDQYGNLIDDYGNKVTLQNADKYKNADEYIKGELRDPSKSVLDIYKFGATPVKDMTSDQKLQAVLLTAQSKGLDISKVTDTQKSSWDMIDTSKLSNLTDVNAIAGSLIRGSDISKEYQFRTPFKSQIPFISQISETSGSVTKNAPSWRFNAYTPTPVPVGYMPLEVGGETLAVKLLGKASDIIKPAKIPLDTESTSGAGGRGAKFVSKSKSSELSIVEPISSLFSETSVNAKDLQSSISSGRNPIINSISEVASVLSGVNPFVVSATTADIGTDIISGKATPESVTSKAVEGAIEATPLKNVVSIIEGGQGSQPVVVASIENIQNSLSQLTQPVLNQMPIKDLPTAATDVLLLANPVTSPFVVSGNMIKFDSNGNALGFGGKGAQNLLTDIQKPSDVEMKSGSNGKTESIEVDVIGNAKKLVWDIPYELGGYVAETSIGNQKSNKNKVTKESIEKVLEKSPNIVIKKSKDDKGNDVIEWMSQENVKKMKSYDSKKEKDLFNKGDKYISDINEYVYGNSKLKSAVSRSESQMPYTIPLKPDVIHFNGVDSNKGLDIVKQNDIKKVNTTASDKDTREWYGYSQLYPQIKSNSTQINPYGSDLKRYGSTMGLNMKLTYNINKKNRGEEMDLQSSLLKDSMNAMAKLQTGFINLTGGAASTVGSALSGLSGNPQLPPVQNQNTDINKKINMGSAPSSSSASVMPSLIPIANYTPKQTPSIDKTYTINNIPVQLPYISQVPGSPIPIQTSSPPSPQETLKSQSKPQSVIQVQGSLIEPGIDYKKQISGYNTDVGDSITRNMIGKTYDISWGPDKGTSMKINSLADALEYKRQQSEAGVNPDIKGINTQARAADYYRNELDKLAQNDVRLSSDYHHAAIKTGVNVGPNPYENAGDAALTFLKGGGRDVLSKSYNWNPSIVGDLGVANLLPGGKGTQETAWSGDKGANFFPAISSWQSAKSSYGPYGSLAKGSNESVSLMPKAYQQALVDIGSGKREGSVYSYAIPDSFVRSQESIRGIVPYNEMTPQQQRQADQEYQNLIANTPDAEFFVPDGKGKQKQIIGKGIANPKTGEFEVYQSHTDPASGQNMRMYQAVGGGGQNAIASGEFSVGTPLTPLVTTQEGTGRIDTTKYGYKLGDAEAVQRALDTHTYDETYSDVGSDIYGGTVQRLLPGKFNRMYEPAVGKDEISSAYDNILTSITGKKNSEDVSRVIVTPDIGTTNYWNMNTKLTSGNLKNLLGDETGTEKPTGSFAWVYPIGEKSPLVTQTDNTPYKSKQEYTVPTSIGYGNTIYGKSGGLDYETLKNVANVVIKPSNSPNYVGTDSNGNLIQATISGEKVDGKPVSTVADKSTQYDTVIPAVPGIMGLTARAQSSGESRDVGKDKSVDITKTISSIPLALATTMGSLGVPTAAVDVAIKHAIKDNEVYNSLYPQQKYELNKVSPDISSKPEYVIESISASALNEGALVGFNTPSLWQSMYIGSQLMKVPKSITNIVGDFTGSSENAIETQKYESMDKTYNEKLDKYNTDLTEYTTLQSQQSQMWDQAMSTGKVKDNVFNYDPQNSNEVNLAMSLNNIDNKLVSMYGDLSTKESELKSDYNALNSQKQKIDKSISDSEYYSLGKIYDNLNKVTVSSTTGMVMPDISSKISQSKEARSIVGESVISAPFTIFLPGSQILASKLIPDNVKTEVGSIPVGLGTGIYDWVREKPIDVMATYLTGKAFPLAEYKGSQVLAAGATSELPVVKTVAQKVSGSPLLADAYIATTRGVLPAAYFTDVKNDIIGDDTTDNSTLARSQRAGKNIAQFGTFMKGMRSVNLPAVENPYAVRDLDRPLEKARIFASSRLNAIGMESGQRTAYLEGINPYKSTRYIEPYKTTEQPDISSLSEIGPKLGPAIEQASIETPHAMMGSGVVEAQASNLPTAKLLRKGKDYDVNTHPLDFVTNLQRITGGKLVKSSSPRAETGDLIIGGKKVAIDPHEFVSGYPDVPGRRYNVEPGYYNEDTVGLGTLLFGDPVKPLPRPEELTIAGKTEGYKGKINFEKLNVQSAKKSKALMNDLQDPMNKGYRLDKDLYDSISIKNELIAVERSRGVTATREKELKLAEKSNEKILDQTITYKNKAGEIKTEKLRDIYNRMENDVIAGNIPPATLTITTSKPSTGVIGKIGKSVGVNIVTSKGLLQRKPFVKTPSKIYDITSSKSKSPVKPSIRSISELPKGSISELKPTDYSKPQLDEPPSPPPQKGSDVYGSPSPSQYSYFTSVSPSYIESPSPSPSPSQSPSEMSPIYNIKYPGYPGTPFMTGAGGGGGGIPGGRPLGIVVKNPLAGLEIAGSAKKYMNFSNVNSGIKNIIGNFGGKTKALNPLGNSQSITSNPTGRGVSLSEATSIQRKKQSLKPKAKLSNTVLKTPSINMNINTNIHNKKKGKRKK